MFNMAPVTVILPVPPHSQDALDRLEQKLAEQPVKPDASHHL
jgi:hypothetical protein